MSGDYYIDERDVEHNYLCSFDELEERNIIARCEDGGYNISTMTSYKKWYVNSDMAELFGTGIPFMFIERGRLPDVLDQTGSYSHTMLREDPEYSSTRIWLNGKCYYSWFSWHESWFKKHIDFLTDEDFLI